MKIPVQQNILNLTPYTPGKPISEVQRELNLEEVTKLASNENPCGPSPKAIQAIHKALSEIHRYPDGSGFYLKNSLGKKLAIAQDQIILGNGTNEILEIAVRTFLSPGEETISGQPAFIIYQLLTQSANGINIPIPLQEHTHNLSAMAEAITSKTKIIFIANPNNPTGTMIKQGEMMEFLQKVPSNILVVMDEAYYEYAIDEQYPDVLSFIKNNPSKPILLLRTFSKAYGLAGLRIGYGLGSPDLISLMNRVRQPFNVNSLALAAAQAALEDAGHLEKSRKLNQSGYQFLCQEFKRMKLSYVPSCTNFILVDVGQKAKEFNEKLLRLGIVVRPMGGYGLTTYVRITIGLEEENKKLVQAINTAIKQ